MSSSTRVPRGRRGTFATVTALLGVVVFAFGAVEAISLAVNGRTVGYHAADVSKYGRDTRLGDTVALVVAIVVFAVGVILLLAAALPARRHLVELTEPDPNVAAGLTRRSLRRTLEAAAISVDGVTDAKVKGRRRRVRVKTRTSLRNVDALPGRVRESVTARLEELNPAKSRAVRVSLDRKDV